MLLSQQKQTFADRIVNSIDELQQRLAMRRGGADVLDIKLMAARAVLRENYPMVLTMIRRFPELLPPQWHVHEWLEYMRLHHIQVTPTNLYRGGPGAEVWPTSRWLFRGAFIYALQNMPSNIEQVQWLFSGQGADVEMKNNVNQSLMHDICFSTMNQVIYISGALSRAAALCWASEAQCYFAIEHCAMVDP